MIGEDFANLESMVGLDEPVKELWLFLALLLLPFRLWPANRVSGDAVRLGVEVCDDIGDAKDFAIRPGEGFGSPRTSFREVLCPKPATCHGEAGFPSSLLSEI